MKIEETSLASSIKALVPKARFVIFENDLNRIDWQSDDLDQPSNEAILEKQAELQAEYDAQAYARNRAAEYPSNGDQWDMIYKDNKNSTTTHADAVEAVKTKWPKDNPGPVE